MRTNVATKQPKRFTHNGATAANITPEQELRRSVLACLLFEDSFYESGVAIGQRITDLVSEVKPGVVDRIALEARSEMNLRHAPLHLMVAQARRKALNADALASVIQRADELTEFLALYWKDGKVPIANQAKKGLAKALAKFDEYQLQKYNRDGKVKLRDVLFLSHAKPNGKARTDLYKRLAENKLATPDTWEVELSTSNDKLASWTRLLTQNKLGGLALLRNLRNMLGVGVPETLIRAHLSDMKTDRILPFRYVAAARSVPQLEDAIEAVMLRGLEEAPKLKGKTAIVVDNSGSMHGPKVSAKSDIDRIDAAAALAVLIREISESAAVIGFGSTASVLPARRGFALIDTIKRGPGGGTDTRAAVVLAANQRYDRIIVITDEQSDNTIDTPLNGTTGYIINVASYQNGIAYGPWTNITGFSESVVRYIQAIESDSGEWFDNGTE